MRASLQAESWMWLDGGRGGRGIVDGGGGARPQAEPGLGYQLSQPSYFIMLFERL